MTMVEMTWEPDSCDCAVVYAADDALAPNEQEVRYAGTVRTCPDHAAITHTPEHLAALLMESRSKNIGADLLVRSMGLDPSDRAQVPYIWDLVGWWHENVDGHVRRTHLEWRAGLTDPERQVAQDELDVVFGPGIVALHAQPRVPVAPAEQRVRLWFSQ